VVEGGEYLVSVGRSSRNIVHTCAVDVAGDRLELPVTEHSTIGEVLAHPLAGPRLAALFAEAMPAGSDQAGLGTDMAKMVESIPLSRLSALGFGPSGAELVQLLDNS
jgi:beta-glucosidase